MPTRADGYAGYGDRDGERPYHSRDHCPNLRKPNAKRSGYRDTDNANPGTDAVPYTITDARADGYADTGDRRRDVCHTHLCADAR